jgi:hypothetical protein
MLQDLAGAKGSRNETFDARPSPGTAGFAAAYFSRRKGGIDFFPKMLGLE